ncbi:MAG: helix-turn-helix transcriptional regulator [Ruminococcaceae bacterium]|nr:helix-turn-helix transcriptional regulator [Oscillospiraceae bacterium]
MECNQNLVVIFSDIFRDKGYAVMLKEISEAKFNPYVRFVNFLENATSENHIIPWRIIYDFEIIFVTKGQLMVLTEMNSYTIKAHELHIMPPFLQHRRTIPKGEVTQYFSVHCDFMYDENSPDFSVHDVYQAHCNQENTSAPVYRDLVDRDSYKPGRLELLEHYPVKNKGNFYNLFNNLLSAFNENGASNIKAKAYLMLIISEIFDDMCQIDAKIVHNEFIDHFLNYVTNHYYENIDLNFLVKNYGISPSRFRTIFKSQLNQAPMSYLIDYRISQARKLLASGKYTVSEVSYMVGYDDVHYFSRLFKQKTGSAPSEFYEHN